MKAAFITVRTESTRLPQKALRLINGRFTIEYVIERAVMTKSDIVVLCTTTLKTDNVLENIAKAMGIGCYRGSVDDKLDRWRSAAEKFKIDFFVTFDGDDLLCDPSLADLAFEQYDRSGADFIEAKNVPCGAFTCGIKVSALNKVCKIKGTNETEMMAPYFTDTGLFRVEQLEGVPEVLQRPDIRLTLDYEEDLKYFRTILKHLESPTLEEVIEFLDENPDVKKINQECQSLYLINQKRLTKVVLNESKQIPWE